MLSRHAYTLCFGESTSTCMMFLLQTWIVWVLLYLNRYFVQRYPSGILRETSHHMRDAFHMESQRVHLKWDVGVVDDRNLLLMPLLTMEALDFELWLFSISQQRLRRNSIVVLKFENWFVCKPLSTRWHSQTLVGWWMDFYRVSKRFGGLPMKASKEVHGIWWVPCVVDTRPMKEPHHPVIVAKCKTKLCTICAL